MVSTQKSAAQNSVIKGLSDERIVKLYSFVEKQYKGDDRNPGLERLAATNYNDRLHGFDHTYRVLSRSMEIGAKEHANLVVVEAAALLHDIAIGEVGDETHARAGAEKARSILPKFGFDADETRRICETIRQHSTDDPTKERMTLEASVLFDADKLDALGVVGFIRFVQEYQKHGVPMKEIPEKVRAHIGRWQERYGKMIFFTGTAREMGKEKLVQLLSLVGLLESETRSG
jgi:uncharacterized protein